jgi:hypothetical protein
MILKRIADYYPKSCGVGAAILIMILRCYVNGGNWGAAFFIFYAAPLKLWHANFISIKANKANKGPGPQAKH